MLLARTEGCHACRHWIPLNTTSQVTTEVVFAPKKREDKELAKPGVNVLRYSVKIKSMPTLDPLKYNLTSHNSGRVCAKKREDGELAKPGVNVLR